MIVTPEQARDFEDAHVEGWHREAPREGCPLCASAPRICGRCNGSGYEPRTHWLEGEPCRVCHGDGEL